MSAEEVLKYNKEIGTREDLTEDERAKLVAAKILKEKEKSRIHYRIHGVREIIGGRKNDLELPPRLEKVIFYNIKSTGFKILILNKIKIMKKEENAEDDNNEFEMKVKGEEALRDLSENGKKSVVEFAASSYAVLENEQVCRIIIERYGKLDEEVKFR